jgi:hypothetical protein
MDSFIAVSPAAAARLQLEADRISRLWHANCLQVVNP